MYTIIGRYISHCKSSKIYNTNAFFTKFYKMERNQLFFSKVFWGI